jgi:hypothetical protein
MRPSAAEPNSTTERRSSANTRLAATVKAVIDPRTASGSSGDNTVSPGRAETVPLADILQIPVPTRGHGLAFGQPAQQMSPKTDALVSDSRGLPAARRWNS